MSDEDERKWFDEQLSRALRISARIRNPEPYVIDRSSLPALPSPSETPEWWKAVRYGLEVPRTQRRRKRDREREQLRSLLDEHEDWLVEEINRRKEARERKAREQDRQINLAARPRWEPPPRFAPPPGLQQHPTKHPLQSTIEDLQQRLDRANGPYQLPSEGWD